MIIELLTWRGISDCLLMATGLFFLYRALFRLGTWKIVLGILIFALFFILASFLDLKGIEWIYRNVSQVAALSFVVLFQPELRKLFEKAAPVKRIKGIHADEQFSQVIADSMWRLAGKRVGGIIVIPGLEPIDEWLNGGYTINAQPSMPLILSIFDPHSPGHDGALIVQKGLFTSFGVRIPVSTSGRLSEEYGTRHQASMGLCEKSDAMVIVVSEERGQVSTFHKGTMTPMQSEKHIFETIMSHCKKTGSFHNVLMKRGFRKTLTLEVLGCLSVALALWITIIADQGEMLEKVIVVPVEYTATAEELVMVGEKANEVRLHLAGPKSDLDSVSPTTMGVKINLSKAVEGMQTVLISEENIRLPKGVRLLNVEPSSVDITIAKITKSVLPVKPQLVGKLPPNFKLVGMEVKPEKVAVFIPSGEVGENFKRLTTTPIYLESLRDNTTLFCKIIAPPAIQPIDKRWPDVEIIFTIQHDTLFEQSSSEDDTSKKTATDDKL